MDGITVMSFASMNDVEDYLMTPAYAQIQAEESKFVDEQKSEYFTCVNSQLKTWLGNSIYAAPVYSHRM